MTRGLRAAGTARSGYPRLGAAWRLLAGAVPLAFGGAARADLATPVPAAGKTAAAKAEQPAATTAKADKPAATANAKPAASPESGRAQPPPPPGVRHVVPPRVDPGVKKDRPKVDPPRTEGLLGRRVQRPGEPLFALARGDEPDAIVLHPHGPDEPCRRRG